MSEDTELKKMPAEPHNPKPQHAAIHYHGTDRAKGGPEPRSYTPGLLWIKLVYVVVAVFVLSFGISFIYGPAMAYFFGTTASGRVVRVVQVQPNADDIVYRFRRTFEDQRDMSISFQHFVAVHDGSQEKIFRLGVDRRVAPYANINDKVTISWRDKDEAIKIAYAPFQVRTWGVGILYGFTGLAFVCMSIPTLRAARKVIIIDPEAK